MKNGTSTGVIVVVHGVGSPAPGSVVKDVATVLTGQATAGTLTGCQVVAPTLAIAGGPVLVEFNWADVQRPVGNAAGLAAYFVRLSLALIEVAQHWQARSPDAASRVIGALRWWFSVVLLWAPLAPIGVLLFLMGPGSLRLALVVLSVLGLIVSLPLSKWYLPLGAGAALWSALGLVVFSWLALARGGPVATGSLTNLEELSVLSSAALYVGAQAASVALACVAAVLILCTRGSDDADRWLTRLGGVYVPLVGVAMVVPVLWACALQAVEGSPRIGEWQRIYCRVVPYDLKVVEWAMAIALVAVAAVFGAGGCAYEWAARRERRARGSGPAAGASSGDLARSGLAVMLRVVPLALLCVVCVLGWSVLTHGRTSAGVLEIYRVSALRVVGLLALLVPALRAAMDVAGDVVFYLAPAGSGLSTKARLQRRLRSCLAAVARSFPGQPVTVLAHSQGSVLAVECLSVRRVGVDRLVTMGSPICTLYLRFLGVSILSGGPSGLAGLGWRNLFRSGDFLGGPIGRGPHGVKNEPLGPGGHTNYWSDRRIAPALR